ncbi:hypothetical protein FRB90_007928 [Tulasnella sp. 427]|nr:hypothetical protein FRB90_007928 [Tulasnella sp. 427]
MPPNASRMTFDGSDASVAFLDLVRSTKISSRANNHDWADLIPTLLYGEALRDYETLPPDCQEDWVQLRDAMIHRFPGPLRSGGIVARSPHHRETSGVSTVAEPPPITTIIERPPTPPPKETNNDTGNDSETKSYVAGLVRRLSLLIGPEDDGRLTVRSFVIERIQGGTILRPSSVVRKVEVDLRDREAVYSAKQAPLLTIPGYEVKHYRVGFTYCINHANVSIGYEHKVLWPREFRISFKSVIHNVLQSPVRECGEYHALLDVIHHGRPYMASPNFGKCPTGEFNIQSYLQQWTTRRAENIANITWLIDVV